MADFTLPELGENVTTGDVLRVMVSPGDTIAKDQPVVELETDKATIEVPSSVAGRVQEVKVKAGDKVKVGQVILTVEDAGGEAAPTRAPASKADAAAAQPAAAEEKPSTSKATRAEEKPSPSETTRAEEKTPDGGLQPHVGARPPGAGADRAPAPTRGTTAAADSEARPERLRAVPAKAGRGEVVDISRGPRPSAEAAEAREPRELVAAAPSVRRLARELGVDITEVNGSGPAGRVSEEDVKAYARVLIAQAAPPAAQGLPRAEPLPDFTVWGEIERKSMSGVRRKTAEHLSHAWSTIPHVTQYDRADISGIEQMRERYAKRAAADAPRLTVTAFAIKVLARAIQVFPQFNASVDMANEEIVYKKYVHIGVAVDTERGLLVPVVRDADKKTILEVSAEIAELAARARDRKLTREEMQGGSFTITNLGGFGGTAFSPIVHWPEVAILGLARAAVEPVFMNGAFQPRPMLPLCLSYDHRAIDGADAIRFLRWVAEALEQPYVLELGA